MNKLDLQNRFLKALLCKENKRSDLVKKVSEILRIEREAVSRRLAGKVYFTISEMGILADAYNISIDFLIYNQEEYQWLPFMLRSPMNFKSIDTLSEMIEANLAYIAQIVKESPSESGNIYRQLADRNVHAFPSTAQIYVLQMGHYFVGTKEFDNFSTWECSPKLEMISSYSPEAASKIDETFIIWDNNLIWQLVGEIESFYRMQAITTEEKDMIKEDVRKLFVKTGGLPQGYLCARHATESIHQFLCIQHEHGVHSQLSRFGAYAPGFDADQFQLLHYPGLSRQF